MDNRTRYLPLPDDLKYYISKQLSLIDFKDHQNKFSSTLKILNAQKYFSLIQTRQGNNSEVYFYFKHIIKQTKNKFTIRDKLCKELKSSINFVVLLCTITKSPHKACGKYYKGEGYTCSRFCNNFLSDYTQAKHSGYGIGYNPFPIYELRI